MIIADGAQGHKVLLQGKAVDHGIFLVQSAMHELLVCQSLAAGPALHRQAMPETMQHEHGIGMHAGDDTHPDLATLAVSSFHTDSISILHAQLAGPFRGDPGTVFRQAVVQQGIVLGVRMGVARIASHDQAELPLSRPGHVLPGHERRQTGFPPGTEKDFYLAGRRRETGAQIDGGICERDGTVPEILHGDTSPFQLEGTGVSVEDFRHGSVSLADAPIDLGPRFATPSGKIEVLFGPWREAGLPSLMPWQDVPRPGKGQFRLIVGRNARHTHSHTQNNPLLYDSLPENRAWIAPERARELGVEDGDAVRMERADGKGGEIRVRVIPGMHPDAVFMLHGFGHRLPVESRARGKGLADQEFMHGGLDKEDAMVHGLALQEHFVTLRPVRNDHAREEN